MRFHHNRTIREVTLPSIERVRTAWKQAAFVTSIPRRALFVGNWAFRKVEESLCDKRFQRHGLATNSIDFDGLGDGTRELRGYVATDWRILRKLFPIGSLSTNDVLLEYGSGKGRVVVWVASRFPLRRVIGLELNPDLVAAARANLERWRGPRRCSDVVLECADASAFEVPDDVTVVYMFNPFMGDVFAQVVAKMSESLRRRPRQLRVIYFYPIMHNVLVEAGFTVEKFHRHPFYPWAHYTFSSPISN